MPLPSRRGAVSCGDAVGATDAALVLGARVASAGQQWAPQGTAVLNRQGKAPRNVNRRQFSLLAPFFSLVLRCWHGLTQFYRVSTRFYRVSIRFLLDSTWFYWGGLFFFKVYSTARLRNTEIYQCLVILSWFSILWGCIIFTGLNPTKHTSLVETPLGTNVLQLRGTGSLQPCCET